MGEPIEFPRRSSGAANPALSAGVLVCAGNNEAQGSRLGLYGPRDGGRGVPVGVGLVDQKIGRSHWNPETGRLFSSVVPRSNPPERGQGVLVG